MHNVRFILIGCFVCFVFLFWPCPTSANVFENVRWETETLDSAGNYPRTFRATLWLVNDNENYFVRIAGEIVDRVNILGDKRLLTSARPQRSLPSNQIFWIWPRTKGYRLDVQGTIPPNVSFYDLTAVVSERYHYTLVPTWSDKSLTEEMVRQAIDVAESNAANNRSFKPGWCLQYVSDLYESTGFPIRGGYYNAQAASVDWVVSQSKQNIPPGALVFFNWQGDGHVGIATEDDKVIHADYDGIIKKQSVAEVEYSNRSRYFLGWGYPRSR